jgi:hypothetical protein
MQLRIFAPALFIVGVSAILAAGQVAKNGQWSFEHYPAEADFQGKPAEPILATPHERRLRTDIREQARKGPNFAGHFTVAQWGCGSPCIGFVIIDARSGAIFDPDLSVGCASKNGMGAGVEFRLKSRLLSADGMTDPTSKEVVCGASYYEWNGKRLKFVHFEPWPDSDP